MKNIIKIHEKELYNSITEIRIEEIRDVDFQFKPYWYIYCVLERPWGGGQRTGTTRDSLPLPHLALFKDPTRTQDSGTRTQPGSRTQDSGCPQPRPSRKRGGG